MDGITFYWNPGAIITILIASGNARLVPALPKKTTRLVVRPGSSNTTATPLISTRYLTWPTNSVQACVISSSISGGISVYLTHHHPLIA